MSSLTAIAALRTAGIRLPRTIGATDIASSTRRDGLDPARPIALLTDP